jgi:hypothetical protein
VDKPKGVSEGTGFVGVLLGLGVGEGREGERLGSRVGVLDGRCVFVRTGVLATEATGVLALMQPAKSRLPIVNRPKIQGKVKRNAFITDDLQENYNPNMLSRTSQTTKSISASGPARSN